MNKTGNFYWLKYLQGDQNFGKVLAEYIGTAVDGLSGGGGAVCYSNANFLCRIDTLQINPSKFVSKHSVILKVKHKTS